MWGILLSAGLTIPQLALQEATGHSNVTVETLDGCLYQGKVRSIDAGSGNVHMETVTHRAADGNLSVMAKVVVKGSVVAMVRLPSVIKKAPFLEAMHSINTATKEGSDSKGGSGGKRGFGGMKRQGQGGGLTTEVLLKKTARDARKATNKASEGGKGRPSTAAGIPNRR